VVVSLHCTAMVMAWCLLQIVLICWFRSCCWSCLRRRPTSRPPAVIAGRMTAADCTSSCISIINIYTFSHFTALLEHCVSAQVTSYKLLLQNVVIFVFPLLHQSFYFANLITHSWLLCLVCCNANVPVHAQTKVTECCLLFVYQPLSLLAVCLTFTLTVNYELQSVWQVWAQN